MVKYKKVRIPLCPRCKLFLIRKNVRSDNLLYCKKCGYYWYWKEGNEYKIWNGTTWLTKTPPKYIKEALE